jgi:hypothetical protein
MAFSFIIGLRIKEKSNKNKIPMKKKPITYVFPVFIVVLLILAAIYFYSRFTPKSTDTKVENINSLKSKKELYSSKTQAYDAYLQDSTVNVRKHNVSIDLKAAFRSAPKAESKVDNIAEEQVNVQQQPVQQQVSVSNPQKSRSYTKPIETYHFKNINVLQDKANEKAVNNTQEITKPTQNYTSDGFGIYTAKKRSVTTSNDSKQQQNQFYPAYFEEDTKIVNSTAFVLILRSDAQIDGISFKKNSIMFGYATDAGTYFDLIITSIKNTDGNTYQVQNVHIYNEKYSKGIVHETKIDKAVKQSGDQTANNVASTVTGTTVYGQLATQAASTTMNALTSQRQASISISQGYRVFIKSDKSE